MEFDVAEGADSSLRDDAGPDGSSEAEMLFTVLRGMWAKPSKKQTEKTKKKFAKSTTTVTNRSQRRKTPRKTKKMGDRTQREEKTKRAKESHDRCSQPPGMRTQALLVVNSFKLHLNSF